MYVILGASGKTGSTAANTLLDRNQPVRVVVRSPEKAKPFEARGAQVAIASIDDTSALTQALQGASGAYVLIPPAYTEPDPAARYNQLINSVVEAVRQSSIPHVVLLSSIGAHLPSGTGPIASLHQAEQRLQETPARLTFIRASYFIENWLAVLEPARTQGTLPTFIPPDKAIPMVATRDIGQLAAQALLDPPATSPRIYELTGPEDYSPRQIAEALSQLLNRTVEPHQLPLDHVVPVFTSMGFSEAIARLFHEMYDAFINDRIDFERGRNCIFMRGGTTPVDVFRTVLAQAASA